VSTSKVFLEPLRVRIRRFQFTVGLGFLALILGSIVSVALSQRLIGRVQALPFGYARFAIGLGVQNLWVLAVLPLLCYGAARILELRPLSTALGAALTGELFLVALQFVQDGVDGWVERGWVVLSMEAAVFALGVWFTHRAIQRGRHDAALQAQQAQQRAASRKDEYAEFLREAERAGEKSAQRDAQKTEVPGGAPETPPPAPEPLAPPPPDAPPPEPIEPTTGEPSKTPVV
jgi:signal transduction histidine kinase